MSGKEKVYQGVRVKITVKELLQKQRARQEAIKTVAKSQVNLSSHELSSVTYMPDYSPGASLPECNLSSGSITDSMYNMPLENGYDSDQTINIMAADQLFFPQSWPQGYPSSNMDYSNCMVPDSPSESFSLHSPAEYSSYSSPLSYSSSSSCYNSPSRMDLGCGLMPENHHPYCSLQHCYCGSPSGLQDVTSQLQYSSYGNTDCWYTSALDDCYFKRDSIDACYR
ncbi:colorectal cancer associated 2 [Alosa pseudoharengus]|uniref:colorectal cancer associated 2 n=1 Tax=Alosa pseudoharengus TaxID=34774 RepID=UPI003F8A8CC2